MRVVIAPESFGDALGAAAAAEAVAVGWRRAAPGDDLVLLPMADGGAPAGPGAAGLDAGGPDVRSPGAALDGAGLVITGEACFDWRSLRDTPVTAVARAAADCGVPCVVLAGQVLVGRREAAAVGVDAAYAFADLAGDAGGSPTAPDAGLDPAALAPDAGLDPAADLAALAERVARRWSR